MALCKSGKWLLSNRKGGLGCGGGGVKPGGKVGGKKVSLGRSKLSPRNNELSGAGSRCVSRKKAAFVTGAAGVLPPWVVEPGPGPTTVDQDSSVASFLWGWGCRVSRATLAVEKDALQTIFVLEPCWWGGAFLFPRHRSGLEGTQDGGKVTGDNSWRGWGAGRLCVVEGGRGECGRQKPHGSLSRAGWQGTTASAAEGRKRRDPAGDSTSWALLSGELLLLPLPAGYRQEERRNTPPPERLMERVRGLSWC